MAGGWAAQDSGPGWRVIDTRSGRQTSCPFEAVALAIDLDDRAVVHQPVHCRNGHGTCAEDVLPLAERLVRGNQQSPAFVAVHHQLEQHRGFGLVLTDVADVVNHQQGVAIELVECHSQGVDGLGTLQLMHKRGA